MGHFDIQLLAAGLDELKVLAMGARRAYHGQAPSCGPRTDRLRYARSCLRWGENVKGYPSRVADPNEKTASRTFRESSWVKENNPKAYVSERFNKDKQPRGDPDCRLGCKRRHNRTTSSTTPTRNAVSAQRVKVGEYYWGYASGVVVAKVPDYGEFVIAAMTQPFDHGALPYFFPLMRQTEE